MAAIIRFGQARKTNFVSAPRRRRMGLDSRFLPKISSKRAALLLTTSLATGLVVGVAMAPRPALAVACIQPASPAPINDTETTAITCTNTVPRTTAVGSAIDLRTNTNTNASITLQNSGVLTSTGGLDGAYTQTTTDYSDISITNLVAGTINAGQDGLNGFSSGRYSDVTIDNYANITAGQSDAAGDGIDAFTTGYDSDIYITNYGNLTAQEDGVYAGTTNSYSDVTIDNNGGDVNAVRDGLFGYTKGYDSNVEITNSGHLGATAPTGRYGIHAFTQGEKSSIIVQNYGAIDSTDEGIYVYTQDGSSDIAVKNHAGADITTMDGIGIYARTQGFESDITVKNYAAIDANGLQSHGIVAVINNALDNASYDAQIYIYNSGAITADADGIQAIIDNAGADPTTSSSDISIRNYGTINAGGDGIFALVTGEESSLKPGTFYGDHIDISIINRADITALEQGIQALQRSPDNGDIDIYTNGTINAGEEAVYAKAYAYHSNIDIHTEGSLTSGVNSDGVFAKQFGYDGTIDIVVNSDVDAGYNGVYAKTVYGQNADIRITQGANSTITSVDDGIDAQAYNSNDPVEGDVTITANGNIIAGEQAIDIDNAYNATVNVNGDSYGTDGGIQVYAYNSLIINVGVGGSLTAGNDLAIDAQGPADADISISGYVRGFMHLDANDDVTVQGPGEWRAVGTTDFDFVGTGGFDRVFNYGVIRTVDPNPAGTEDVYFDNLEEFHNGGGSGPGLITMVNDLEGDTFSLNYNAGGNIEFYGDSGSKLAVDTYVSAGEVSDKLYVYGDTNGRTLISVRKTNTASLPDYTDGIAIVVVSGNTIDDNFALANGPIQSGFFAWDLVTDYSDARYNGNATHELITIGPSSLGDQLAIGITSAQEIWHQTTGVWADRNADLRLQLSGPGAAMSTADLAEPMAPVEPPESGRSVTPGIWAKGVGVWENIDGDTSINGPNGPTKFNLDHDLRIAGVIGGIDMGWDTATPDDALILGVMGGYLTGNLDFDEGGHWDFNGGTVGGYATYIKGGFFVDGLVKADFLNVDIHGDGFGGGGGSDDDTTNVTSVGGRVDTGYRFGERFFIEPQATLAYVHTDFDDVSIFGGDVKFNEDDSLRGRVGARIGAVFETASMRFAPDVTGSVWQEFAGDNEVKVSGFGGAADLPTFSDSQDSTMGEVAVGVSAVSLTSGWSGFTRGKWQFSDDVEAFSVHGGLRYNW